MPGQREADVFDISDAETGVNRGMNVKVEYLIWKKEKSSQ
jgi:hypothetical protein